MVLFNHATRELTAKVVYYGPGLGGKTTNLKLLQERLERGTAGRLLSLSSAQDRTIYFDLLPVELGNIKGYTVRFQLCTVPGQVFYNETRKLVLKGVDGLVFVVDSQWSMLSHNLESFANLQENLAEAGVALSEIPVVVQYNKRDLPGVLPIKALQDSLGFGDFPFVEAVASEGTGVVETFKLASKLTFVHLLKRIQKPGFLGPADAPEEEELAEKEGRTVQIDEPFAPRRKPSGSGDDSSWLRMFRGRTKAPRRADDVFPAEESQPIAAVVEAAASTESPETVAFLPPAVPKGDRSDLLAELTVPFASTAPIVPAAPPAPTAPAVAAVAARLPAPPTPPITVETELASPPAEPEAAPPAVPAVPDLPAAPAAPAIAPERLAEIDARFEALEARAVELSSSLARAISDVSTRSELERVQRVEETARLMDRLLSATREEAWSSLGPLGERIGRLEPLASELEELKGRHGLLDEAGRNARSEASAQREELSSLGETVAALRGEASSLSEELGAVRAEIQTLKDGIREVSSLREELSRLGSAVAAANVRNLRLVAALREALSGDDSGPTPR